MRIRPIDLLVLAVLAQASACTQDTCGELQPNYELGTVEVSFDNGHDDLTLSTCVGGTCVDTQGRVYEGFDFDTVLAQLPPSAVRAMGFALSEELFVVCGEAGEVWTAPASDPSAWTEQDLALTADFSAAGGPAFGARCLSVNGTLLLDEGLTWVEHETYPSAPAQLVSEGVLRLEDGSVWELDAANYGLERQLFAETAPISSVRALTVDGETHLHAVTTSGGLWQQVPSSGEPARELDVPHKVVAAEVGLLHWTLDDIGCAHVGSDFESPVASVCASEWMQADLIDSAGSNTSEMDAFFLLEGEFSLLSSTGRRVGFGVELKRCGD